ncbi:MAG TPA: hypothetical protein PLS53_00225 [Thermoanaerobaculaceae bacterium]|nr:hypothetical protein [Thermoanaerobaculaceae bacterium]
MKATGNRRAHFPVGGKRNTMNFFGHGNRPKKKGKAKTAADEEDDDERPQRRRKGSTSHQWAILAAVGAMGAAGVYWAFQNPKVIRGAAKALGIDDNDFVKGALNALDPKKPEDRAAKEAELAGAAAAEHGHAAPEITDQNPVARPPQRELNQQEAGIVAGLQNGGHAEAAKQLAETWKQLPDVGVLQLPRKLTGDPVRDAGTFMAARAQYDQFRAQAEHDVRVTAAQHGASEAEIKQLAAQAAPRAQEMYQGWVQNPATLTNSAKLMSAPTAQGFGSKEIFDAQAEEARTALTNPEGVGVATRNREAQQADVGSSRPATSPFASTGDHLDQVLTALSPGVLSQANMVLGPMGYGADARGVLNPHGDPDSAVIRNPEDHWQANRARAVLDRQNAVQDAIRAGDHEGARMLLAEPLPGSTETLADIEAANDSARLHDAAGRASSAAALSTALRVSAPVMGPLGVLGVGGGLALGQTAAKALKGEPVADTPEARAGLTETAGRVGGFAAQTAAMRSRPQFAAQVAEKAIESLKGRLPAAAQGAWSLRDTLMNRGPSEAYNNLLKQIEQQTGKLNTALQAAKTAPGVGAVPEGLHAVRAAAAAPAGAGFGARAAHALKSGFQQAKWVGSLSTAAEASAALGRISQTAVKSPALVALMRVNALRGAGALSAASVQYGIIGTGALAVADISGHALNAIKGEARSRSYEEQYRRAYNGTLRADGRLESNWGTGSMTGNARDMAATGRNAVMMDFQYIMERQAAVTGYSRAKFEGGSHDIIRGAGAAVSGVNDPETGFYEQSAEYRGVQDALYFTAERRALQRGTEIATQIIEGDPRFANAPVATRDEAIMTTAARISAQYVSRLKDTTILEHNIDEAIGALDLKVKTFKPNPVALLDSSGGQLYGEGARFLNHILPDDVAENKALHEDINALGHYNAARNNGIQDPDALTKQGRDTEVYAASNDYAWKNRSKMAALPGGIGDAFKAHDAVYGPARRAALRALDAPELRHADPKRRQEIYDAVMKNAETKAKPMIEEFLKAPGTHDIADLMKPGTGPDGKTTGSRIQTWQQQNGYEEAPRTALGITGSAEAARDQGFAELRRLLPQEQQGLLDPVAISQEADRVTGQTFDQRNNTEAGLYTKSSPTGQAIAARREQWAQDLRSSGIKLPLDDAGFQRFVGDGPNSRRFDINNVTADRASKLYALETLAAQDPEKIRQLAPGASSTAVLLAQERPWLEKAMADPSGKGFTRLGPDGNPVGTVATWEELRADMANPANAANYAKAWRPEVQKYLTEVKQYDAQRVAPVSTPEIDKQLDIKDAYGRWTHQERMAQEQARAQAEAQTKTPLQRNPLVQTFRQVVAPSPAYTPSMTPEQFAQKFRADPSQFKGVLTPEALEYQQRYATWEKQQAGLKAPAGPGATPGYVPAKPAVLPAAKPAPTPAVATATPAPIGQPAKL